MRLRDLSIDNPFAHIDFPKLRKGGVDAAFFALYTSGTMEPDAATRYALEMLAGVNDAVEASSDMAALAYTPEEALRNKQNGKTSIFLGMENGLPIQGNLALLRQFYRMGVRYMTLTHNTDNQICDSAAQGQRWGGLSPFGREVIAEMNRLGMIIDLAHASDKTFYDCIKYSCAPVVSTHSCCRALAGHRRNMTDDMIKAVADVDGVIQINFYPLFLSDEFAETLERSGLDPIADEIEARFIKNPASEENRKDWNEIQQKLAELKRPSYKRIIDHIDHAVNIAGIEHVGIGSDFDGINVTPEGMEDASKIPVIFEEMKNRGYSQSDIEKVAGLNFLRVMETVSSLAENK